MAEARHAERLDRRLRDGEIVGWTRQVPLRVGEDHRGQPVVWRADFLVAGVDGRAWIEEVKGAETDRWRDVAARWRERGWMPLLVIDARGEKRETIVPKILSDPETEGTP